MSKPQPQIKIIDITGDAYLSIKLIRSPDPDILTTAFLANVEIRDHGFTCQNGILISLKDFAQFLENLKKCHETHTGKASLTGEFPKEFLLEIYIDEQSGHFSLKYFLGKSPAMTNLIRAKYQLTGEFLFYTKSMAKIVTECLELIPDLATIIENEYKLDPSHWLKLD